MKRTISWIVLVVVISAAIILALVNNELWGLLIQLGAALVGFYVGDFSMRGAYRLFELGESAVRSIAWGVGVGGVIIWLTLVIVLEPRGEPNLAAIAVAGTFGATVGAVTKARAISKQLRTEDHHP